MPPQQTDISSKTGDAAALRFDLSIVLRRLQRAWRALAEWRRRAPGSLQDLSDRQLRDIGLTQGDLDRVRPDRAVNALRDRTLDLWSRRGM